MTKGKIKSILTGLISVGMTATSYGAITGHWDFNGSLAASVGNELMYFDGDGGPTSQDTAFGSSDSFGIPGIDGQPLQVMRIADITASTMGYVVRPDLPANGGGSIANQWSMVMDIYYPAESAGQSRALLQIDDPFTNSNAAEVYIDGSNAIGATQNQGVIDSGVWNRIVIAVDQSADSPVMTKYVNGIQIGQEILPVDAALGKLDGRWAILDRNNTFGGDSVLLFTDNNANSAVGYIASLQFHDEVLTSGYVSALGGVSVAGIPTEVTATASLERISPAPDEELVFPETPIEVVLVDGDAAIPSDSISLALNGVTVTPVINDIEPGKKRIFFDPGLLEPGSVNTVALSYTDPAAEISAVTTEWSFTMAPYNQPPLDASEDSLLYLPFEEATANNGDTVEDFSPMENTGTLVLADTAGDRRVSGKVGSALDLNVEIGSGDLNYVQLAKPYGATPNTFACWMKIDPNFPDGTRVGVMIGTYPEANNINWEVHTSGLARFWWNNGEVDWRVPGIDMRTGEWEHIVFVRDTSEGAIHFYLNGKRAASLNQVGSEVDPQAAPFVGGDLRGAGTHIFKGQLDEVALFARPLTPTEVFRLYANAFDFPEFQFPTPQILSVTPLEGAVNVGPESDIEVLVDEGSSLTDVVDASVILTLNGQSVPVELSRNEGLLTVHHQNTAPFESGSVVQAELQFEDTDGGVTNFSWEFQVAPAPTILQHPLSVAVFAGASITLSVEAETVPPVAYQWRFNGEPIPDATESRLVLINVQPSQAGSYDVEVADLGGSVVSSVATVTVNSEELPEDPAESLPFGLVAAWPFDEDFTSIIPGFDGEPINGAALNGDSKIGTGSVTFTQSLEQYVDIDQQVIADGSLTYSAAGWFKVTGGEGRRFLWETSDSNWAISAEVTPAGTPKAFIRLEDGTSTSADTGVVVNLNEWYHLAVSFDGGAGEAKVYLNGVFQDVAFSPEIPVGVGTSETVGFHIGSYRAGNGRFFEGQIDDVGVWTRVLRDEEVAFLADGNAIPEPNIARSLQRGLKAAWHFDGDFSSFTPEFDGEPINGAVIANDFAVGSGSVSLVQAQQQYVDVQTPVILDGSLTYSAAGWFKVTGGSGRRFLWETSDSNWAISAEITPAGTIKAFARLEDGTSTSADTGIIADLDVWYHVAVTFDSAAATAAVYVNGQRSEVEFAPAIPQGVGTAATVGFHIGSFRGGSDRFFEGMIDEVGVWDRVLSELEIIYLAEGNLIPDADPALTLLAGQKASWNFDGDFTGSMPGFDGAPINGAMISDDAKVGTGSVSLIQTESQYVDVDNQVILDGSLIYSVAGWFKVTGGEGRRFLWETSDSNWAISAEVTPAGSPKVFARLADGTSTSADTGVVMNLNEWYHLAVTFNSAVGIAQAFLNGELQDIVFSPEIPVGVGTAETVGFHIGSYRAGNGRFFDGLIDDVGVWDRVLLRHEIDYLSQGQAIPRPKRLEVPVEIVITSVEWVDGMLNLIWSGGAGPFRVQTQSELGSAEWTDVSDPITESSIQINPVNASGFYRIVQP